MFSPEEAILQVFAWLTSPPHTSITYQLRRARLLRRYQVHHVTTSSHPPTRGSLIARQRQSDGGRY